MYSWGKNKYGQLGQGETLEEYIIFPKIIEGPLYQVKIDMVACGWQHTLAITMNGFLFSWGLNITGQLGLGDFVDRYYPA